MYEPSHHAWQVGDLCREPALHRYVNVVEEMSIASGAPVPHLCVPEREQGINAFAIGFGPADAAIIVAVGALKELNRG
ncbi:MAG: hypothetical protein ACTHPS_15085 [Streptosporangiaceae bacterium]